MEAGIVLGLGGEPLFWHLPPGRSRAGLPDSRELWEAFWENRARLSGFAHSHPGRGLPGPSAEDLTTFAAVEAALGQRLDWWIASEDRLVLGAWRGPVRLAYGFALEGAEPDWAPVLRRLSRPGRGPSKEEGIRWRS